MQRISILRNHLSSTHTFTKITVEKLPNSPIGVITMNAPKELNALSETMKAELSTAVNSLDSDNKIKVIILRSNVPKAFCAGANIKEFENMTIETQTQNDIFYHYHNSLDSCKKPIIALVNGVALGGGFETALLCDIILMAEDARVGLPEITLGTIPGIGGTQRLTKIVGKQNAMKAILTGEPIPAKDAFALGICQGVYKAENLYEEGLKLAEKIASKALTTIILAKKAIRGAENLGLEEGIKFEREIFNASITSKAFKEGSTAFIEKRKPNFKDS